MNYNKLLLFGLFLCMAFTMQAQKEGLPTGEVDVIDEFEARLIDAERFVVNPLLPPLDTTTRLLNYNITSKALQVQYLPPRINPLRLTPPPMDPIYNGYMRIGAGFPTALYLDGAYDFINDDAPINIGIDLFHNSANNKKIENQKFSNTLAKLNATYYNDFGFKVEGNVGYSQDVVHFYGYNDLDDDFTGITSYAEDDVKQRFSNFFLNARLNNNQPTVSNIDYNAEIDYYRLQDNYAARESGYKIGGELTKWFDEKHPLKVRLLLDLTSYQDTAKQSLNNYYLQPSYAFHGESFRIKLGLNLASHEDEFYFFPDIEASANLFPNLLTAFVGAKGDLYKNNLKSLSDYNPFIVTRFRVENSFTNKFYGGIKGDYEGYEYRIQASYEDVDNLPLFTTNGDSIPRFNVLYDTANIFTLSAEVDAPLLQNLDIRGSIISRVYDLSTNDKAWHLPSVSVNAGATYRMLDNQLTLKGDLFLENGVPVPTDDGSRSLNGLLDVSGSAEYLFSENFGGFVRVNNIFNNRRERWRHYPTLGLNAILGVSAKF